MDQILSVEDLTKEFQSGHGKLKVLSDINFQISKGDITAIVGPSGSGKTTLLGLCAGLDNASSGDITLRGESLTRMDEDQKAQLRNEYVGFIFQNFQLITSLTAIENVMVPMELAGMKNPRNRAEDLLDRVGLADRSTHYPRQLSGGEQQRVAIARAFANDPEILFADEPTGNLDEETGQIIENLLFTLNKEQQTTLILVTHDFELAGKAGRILRIKGGKIVADELTTRQIKIS